MMEEYLKPCQICKSPTSSPTGRCSPCYQVEQHLEAYLSHSAGRCHAYYLMSKVQGAIDKMGRMKRED